MSRVGLPHGHIGELREGTSQVERVNSCRIVVTRSVKGADAEKGVGDVVVIAILVSAASLRIAVRHGCGALVIDVRARAQEAPVVAVAVIKTAPHVLDVEDIMGPNLLLKADRVVPEAGYDVFRIDRP